MSEILLQTKDLCKKFKGQTAVNELSLSIQKTLYTACSARTARANPQR